MPIVVYRKLMSGRFDQISGDLFDLTSLCNSRTPISSRYIENRVFNERLPIHLADIKKTQTASNMPRLSENQRIESL